MSAMFARKHTRRTAPPPAHALVVGDTVVDVGTLVQTGKRIVGTVVRLLKKDGVDYVAVKGPVGAIAEKTWLEVNPARRWRVTVAP